MAKIVKGNIEATGEIKGDTIDVSTSAIVRGDFEATGEVQGSTLDVGTDALVRGDFETNGDATVGGNIEATGAIGTSEFVVSTKGYNLPDNYAVESGISETVPLLYSKKDFYLRYNNEDYYRNYIALDTIPYQLHQAAGSTASARSTYPHSKLELSCLWDPVPSNQPPTTLTDQPTIFLSSVGEGATTPNIELRSTQSTTGMYKKMVIKPDSIRFQGSSNPGNLVIELPNLPVDGNTAFDSYYLGVDTEDDNKVYRHANLYFFTGTHIYKAASDLAPGTAVELVNGSVQATSSANSSICVGIVAQTKEATEDNPIKTSLGESITSGWAIKLASVGDVRHRSTTGFLVCNEGGDIAPGDLLVTSSTPGYLMKQADDIIRSTTVGKAMEAPSFDENGQASGIYGYIYCG